MYNLSNKLGLGNIRFAEECYCEWCCQEQETRTMQWSDGEYWHCMECAKLDDNFNVTELEMKTLKDLEIRTKIKYFGNRIKELEKKLGGE